MSDVRRIACANRNCGTFPLDEQLYQKLQRTGETFHCPDGHPQHFSGSNTKKLKQRVEELESKLERAKKRADRMNDRAHSAWDQYQEQKQRRKFAESRLLDYAKGVVEVGPEQFRWSCECDSRGQKTFADVDNAKSAFKEHRRRRCSIEDYEEVTTVE